MTFLVRAVTVPAAWLAALILSPALTQSLAFADQASLAVAANFTAPMQQLAEDFEKSSGHQLRLTFGSSGKFFAQIKNGAPFDVLLSADSAKPQALCDQGLAVKDTPFTYAFGSLALWSTQKSSDLKRRLEQGDYNKLAIANPRLAPYGAAAIEVLEHMQIIEAAKPKLVQGENISQTYQFVASANADLGFVALSQIIKDGKTPTNAWPVPAALHSPIEQNAVLLMRGKDNLAARALLNYLRSDAARAIIASFGYGTEASE